MLPKILCKPQVSYGTLLESPLVDVGPTTENIMRENEKSEVQIIKASPKYYIFQYLLVEYASNRSLYLATSQCECDITILG